MALADEIAESLEGLEGVATDGVQTFTWGGKEYPCFASGATTGGKMDGDSWSVFSDLVIVVRGNLFAETKPKQTDELTHAGREYLIDRLKTAPGGAILTLYCTDKGRGV